MILLSRWLQDVFDVPLVIMLTDDEKYMHSPKIDIDDVRRFSRQNAMDIIAVGFDMKKTFIFSDFDFIGGAFYENMCRMAKRITMNSVKGTFGFNERQASFCVNSNYKIRDITADFSSTIVTMWASSTSAQHNQPQPSQRASLIFSAQIGRRSPQFPVSSPVPLTKTPISANVANTPRK